MYVKENENFKMLHFRLVLLYEIRNDYIPTITRFQQNCNKINIVETFRAHGNKSS